MLLEAIKAASWRWSRPLRAVSGESEVERARRFFQVSLDTERAYILFYIFRADHWVFWVALERDLKVARLFRGLIDLLSEDEAKVIAGPHLLRLRGCIEDGIRAVEKREAQDPEFFRVYPSGTRAALVYWQIVHLAESRFQGVGGGVSTSHNRRFLTILIDDRLEIRFKKLDPTGRSRNYPTAHQEHYQLQRRLVGMEEPTAQPRVINSTLTTRSGTSLWFVPAASVSNGPSRFRWTPASSTNILRRSFRPRMRNR